MLDMQEIERPPVVNEGASGAVDDVDDVVGYQRLWAAVIMAHFRAAFTVPSASNTALPPVEIARSKLWFASAQCDLVCEVAGICPRRVRQAYEMMKADPEAARERLRAVVSRTVRVVAS